MTDRYTDVLKETLSTLSLFKKSSDDWPTYIPENTHQDIQFYILCKKPIISCDRENHGGT